MTTLRRGERSSGGSSARRTPTATLPAPFSSALARPRHERNWRGGAPIGRAHSKWGHFEHECVSGVIHEVLRSMTATTPAAAAASADALPRSSWARGPRSGPRWGTVALDGHLALVSLPLLDGHFPRQMREEQLGRQRVSVLRGLTSLLRCFLCARFPPRSTPCAASIAALGFHAVAALLLVLVGGRLEWRRQGGVRVLVLVRVWVLVLVRPERASDNLGPSGRRQGSVSLVLGLGVHARNTPPQPQPTARQSALPTHLQRAVRMGQRRQRRNAHEAPLCVVVCCSCCASGRIRQGMFGDIFEGDSVAECVRVLQASAREPHGPV